MLNVRLAGDHLYGKLLFTWLSLVMSMMVSFCAVLFPTRCLGWDLELNWASFWGFSFLLLIWHFHEFCDYATSSNIHGPRVITSVQNVYPMRMVTDIGKYVAVAARQIILKESSIKKLVANKRSPRVGRLWRQSQFEDLRTYRTLIYLYCMCNCM